MMITSEEMSKKDILPDVLAAGLDLVFCGTAPSKTSEKAGAYYANGRNRFWKILHECKLTDSQLNPKDFRLLKTYKIGLTDLCKLESGSDDSLSLAAFLPGRLRQSIETYRPRYLVFTSGNAGKKFFGRKIGYGPQDSIGVTKVFVLPTTSPRRSDAWWNEKKAYWRHFADEFHRVNEPQSGT